MKNNIFKDAKFGDKFLTRNGEVAIYHYNNGDSHHKLILESGYGYFCKDNGYEDDDGYIKSDCDIVSRYQEPIDEKKKIIEKFLSLLDKAIEEWNEPHRHQSYVIDKEGALRRFKQALDK